jgi:pro-apoptotic serine protease NMA111
MKNVLLHQLRSAVGSLINTKPTTARRVASAVGSPFVTRNLFSTHSIMNGPTTSPRTKRKASHPVIDDRPSKHLRPLNGAAAQASTGDNTPDNNEEYDMMEMEDDGSRVAPLMIGPDTAEWQATIQHVVRNVVSVRFCLTCSFDTDAACNSEATGFVVDAERG